MTPNLFVKKITKESIPLPFYATPHSSGADIHALLPNGDVLLHPGQTELISTGLQMRPSPGYDIKIYPRSGLSLKGITLGNCVGIGDYDYSNEYKIVIHNHGNSMVKIEHLQRIAQIIVEPVQQAQIVEVDALPDVENGGCHGTGFGSTGS